MCGESSPSSSGNASSLFPMIIEIPVDAEGEMVGDLTTVLGIGTNIGVPATGRALTIQQTLDATSARCSFVQIYFCVPAYYLIYLVIKRSLLKLLSDLI